MQLTPGTKVGPYEILAPLGAGGMGEVYRARDTRLGRDVALKVLPQGLASDSARLARFEREARLLASLNHPNIAAIFGFEPMGNTGALVMELVEGPTLADRILQGSLPLEDAVSIARQIAEALEVAHDSGIVHRDLKPANVKLRPDGTVKVLDFGLAKALETESSLEKTNLTQSPTLSQQMTGVGMILGTAAYMAPEQAKGKNVDRRADIWAFGVVLYEMFTGRQLFQGETVSETLASVMKDEVSWQVLPSDLPAHIRSLLRRCLTRDPRQRLQSIGEARIILDSRGEAALEPGQQSTVATRTRPRPLLFVGAAIGLALTGFGAAWTLRAPEEASGEVRKYPMALHPDAVVTSLEAVISPDGRHVAFYADGKLWVRSLVTLETRELSEAQSSNMRPFWSPDGEHIGFTDGIRLVRIPVGGGTVSPICVTPVSPAGGTGASWSADGRIVFALGARGLFEVNAAGGDAREILPTDSTSSDFHEPLILKSKAVCFIRHRRVAGPDTFALFDGKTTRDLLQVPDAYLGRPAWSPSGHLLFHRYGGNSGLWALPFSLETLKATGDPFLVATDGTVPSVTVDGKLLYSRGTLSRSLRAVWVDRSGAVMDTLSETFEDASEIVLSPDRRRAVMVALDAGNRDIWVIDLERHTKTRVTFDRAFDNSPVWGPDGEEIYYASAAGGNVQSGAYAITGDVHVFATSSRGGGSPRLVVPGHTPAVSPDGSWLAYVKRSEKTQDDIFIKSISSREDGTPIVQGPSDDIRPAFEPKGRFMAYTSEESGRIEVYITRVPSGQGRWQVSVNGGRRPRWSPAGDRLYFQSLDSSMLLEVDVTLGEVPVLGTPRVVFDLAKSSIKTWGGCNFDVDVEAKRFVALVFPSNLSQQGNVIVVENWAAEFDKK